MQTLTRSSLLDNGRRRINLSTTRLSDPVCHESESQQPADVGWSLNNDRYRYLTRTIVDLILVSFEASTCHIVAISQSLFLALFPTLSRMPIHF